MKKSQLIQDLVEETYKEKSYEACQDLVKVISFKKCDFKMDLPEVFHELETKQKMRKWKRRNR